MPSGYHRFHIPVMGTGHTADTPLRVAPLGISSVISLVDDLLLEELRAHYSRVYGLPYTPIARHAEDGRARRITAYLDLVGELVGRRLEEIRALPFGRDNAKDLYFRLLPDTCDLKRGHREVLRMAPGPEREARERALSGRMRAGSIDVNIMVKVDRVNYGADGQPLGEEYRDAMAALRGYAHSSLRSAVVLSAGINQALYSYMARFPCFYRGPSGEAEKRIVIKVSDYRSARIQGQYLARMGLEVAEYRVESGLNCGGHAFATAGQLLPGLLREFAENRDQLVEAHRPKVRAYYAQQGWDYPDTAENGHPLLTVQGGIGTAGEARRLMEDYGADATGWATPFLLVPEATGVDAATREQLVRAGADDLFVSDASPLAIPFHNLRGSGSERRRLALIAAGTPGSPCPKGYGVTNTEFTERAICLSSRRYQRLKLAQIAGADLPEEERTRLRALVLSRSCICDHLGNSLRIALGLAAAEDAPQAVCPGPNLAWFDRTYSLEEMVDHIYGRGPSLTPAERPHMFAQELTLYVDHFERLVRGETHTPELRRYLRTYARNLAAGMDDCLEVAERTPYPGENLASIPPHVAAQRERLQALCAELEHAPGDAP